MAVTDYAYIKYTRSDGSIKALPVAKTTTCDQRPTSLTPEQIAALVDVPGAQAGFDLKTRVCANDWPTYADATNDGYTAPGGGGDPDPDPTPGNFGATTFFPSGNPNLLSIGHEWVMHDGEMKARIFNQVNPTPPNGSSNFFYFCGFKNPDQGTFSERFIRPGTFCQVYIGQGPRKEIYHDGYPNKAQQQFWIGNPPTN